MSHAVFLTPHDELGSIHGGKIRTKELVRSFADHGLLVTEIRMPQESADEKFLPKKLRDVPLIRDLALSFSSAHADDVIEHVVDLGPDVLVLEHPWLWGTATQVLKALPHCRLVYSSHNVEWRLKLEILRRYAPSQARQAAEAVWTLEKSVAMASSFVLAASERDAHEIESWTESPVYVIPNGVEEARRMPESPTPARFPYAVVVGSSHPPNIEGCLEYLGTPSIWLPPGTELWVIGSLASAMSAHWGESYGNSASGGVRLLGEAEDSVLGQVLTHAHSVLVPVAYGEGSNLKTAEAIYVGRPVVASTSAMSSFERVAGLENVVTAGNAMEFKTATARFLSAWCPSRDVQVGEELTWRHSRKLVGEVLKHEGLM